MTTLLPSAYLLALRRCSPPPSCMPAEIFTEIGKYMKFQSTYSAPIEIWLTGFQAEGSWVSQRWEKQREEEVPLGTYERISEGKTEDIPLGRAEGISKEIPEEDVPSGIIDALDPWLHAWDSCVKKAWRKQFQKIGNAQGFLREKAWKYQMASLPTPQIERKKTRMYYTFEFEDEISHHFWREILESFYFGSWQADFLGTLSTTIHRGEEAEEIECFEKIRGRKGEIETLETIQIVWGVLSRATRVDIPLFSSEVEEKTRFHAFSDPLQKKWKPWNFETIQQKFFETYGVLPSLEGSPEISDFLSDVWGGVLEDRWRFPKGDIPSLSLVK